MKPVKNHVYCPACGRAKILFKSEKKALNFIKWNGEEILDENGKAPVRAYYCTLCGGWHVTSIEELPEDYKTRNELIIERFIRDRRRQEMKKAIAGDCGNVKKWYQQVELALDLAEHNLEDPTQHIKVKEIVKFLKTRMRKYDGVSYLNEKRVLINKRITKIEAALCISEEVDVNYLIDCVSKNLHEANALFDYGMYDDVQELVSNCLLMLSTCRTSIILVDERKALHRRAKRLRSLCEKVAFNNYMCDVA